MKIFILAIFLVVCAWAQGPFTVNLCPTYACPNGENCADKGYFVITDRTDWSCNAGKCVAPQCQYPPPLVGSTVISSFAQYKCPSGYYCNSSYMCVPDPVVPVPTPEPQPSAPVKMPVIDLGFMKSGASTGDYCTQDADCTIGTCNGGMCALPNTFSPNGKCTPPGPVSCTNSDQCYEGTCFGDICSRSDYRQNLNSPCQADTDCFSNSCSGNQCDGTDCTNFVCVNSGYYCDYIQDNNNNPQCSCFPDYDTFSANCDFTKNYVVQKNESDPQSLWVCTPKKDNNSPCGQDVECTIGWCNGGICSTYPKNAVPAGKYCGANNGLCVSGLICSSQGVCSTGVQGSGCFVPTDCNSGLICNSSRLCTTGNQGDSCYSVNDCQPKLFCNTTSSMCAPLIQNGESCTQARGGCAPGLYCQTTDNQNYNCGQSATLGQYCAWDMNGNNNCTAAYGETCACFAGDAGSNMAKCVSTESTTYTNEYQKYVPPSPAPAPNPQIEFQIQLNNAQTNAIACEATQFSLDINFIDTLPSIMIGPYERSKSAGKCNIIGANYAPTSAECINEFAKYFCCSLCSGILDVYLTQYPGIDRNAQTYYSPYFNSLITLSCAGSEPTFSYNPNSCGGPAGDLHSLNDILNKLDCGNAVKPSYATVSVTITFPAGTDTSNLQNNIESIVQNALTANKAAQPTYVTVTPDPNNPNTGLIVTLTYAGPANNADNISAAQSALGSSAFTGPVNTYVPTATVSQPSSQTVVGSGAQSSIMFSMISLIVFVLIGLLF